MTEVVALLGRTSHRAPGRAAADVDLDPRVVPGELYPAPGGLDARQLHDVPPAVVARARIVGVQITCLSTPELGGMLAQVAAPLMEAPAS
jgi:arginase family enzyme